MQAIALTRIFIKTQPMEPRAFCRIWLSADTEDKEAERGYRAKCVQLLVATLGIAENTVSKKWGGGLNFEKMPEHHKLALANAHIILLAFKAAKDNPDLRKVLAQCLDWPQLLN